MTKKYCENCKWFEHDERGNNRCNFIINEKDTPIRIKKVYNKLRIANKTNACPDYKKIWYRYWIK